MPVEITPQTGDALIIVDVQNDILTDGNLPILDSEAVIPVLNEYLRRFSDKCLPVYATRDWHPANHCSFNTQGGPWPAHCVADTPGAAFVAALHLPQDAVVISKANLADVEDDSAFAGTELEGRLHAAGVRRLFIGGLATDYAVLNTVCDALKRSFGVCLLIDAIRAVNICPGDGARAIDAMLELGAVPTDLQRLAA
ncbi:MAG: hypothetical protein B7Z47_01645 [Chthoniobacter sp. 12-60-6]|nr:MAG: hypothetical protein B7Z47_01645 [Chthoniobacter sp. 12-60-6]